METDKPAETSPGALPEQFELHPSLIPLQFLVGRWEGAGVVGYPTIESANFGQEISFSHNGKPFLIYNSRTWLLEPDGTIGPACHGDRFLAAAGGRRSRGAAGTSDRDH